MADWFTQNAPKPGSWFDTNKSQGGSTPYPITETEQAQQDVEAQRANPTGMISTGSYPRDVASTFGRYAKGVAKSPIDMLLGLIKAPGAALEGAGMVAANPTEAIKSLADAPGAVLHALQNPETLGSAVGQTAMGLAAPKVPGAVKGKVGPALTKAGTAVEHLSKLQNPTWSAAGKVMKSLGERFTPAQSTEGGFAPSASRIPSGSRAIAPPVSPSMEAFEPQAVDPHTGMVSRGGVAKPTPSARISGRAPTLNTTLDNVLNSLRSENPNTPAMKNTAPPSDIQMTPGGRPPVGTRTPSTIYEPPSPMEAASQDWLQSAIARDKAVMENTIGKHWTPEPTYGAPPESLASLDPRISSLPPETPRSAVYAQGRDVSASPPRNTSALSPYSEGKLDIRKGTTGYAAYTPDNRYMGSFNTLEQAQRFVENRFAAEQQARPTVPEFTFEGSATPEGRLGQGDVGRPGLTIDTRPYVNPEVSGDPLGGLAGAGASQSTIRSRAAMLKAYSDAILNPKM